MEQLVLVTVTGPDPKLVKRELTSNSSSKDGQTALNSTGLIFTALPGFIVTSLLPIYPFLSHQFRSQPSSVSSNLAANGNFYKSQTTLLPGTRITCSFTTLQESTSYTEQVQLERIIELKDVRAALRSLLTAPSASKWSLGWGGNSELPLEAQLDLASHVVVLKLPSKATTRKSPQATTIRESHHQSINNLSSLQLGTPITAVGCPFSALVSLKFHNFMINGAISALLLEKHQSPTTPPTLLVALSDLKLLPGMEGGIVYANSNRKYILGIAGPPLRAPEANAELSVIISATAVLEAVVQNVVTIDGSSPTTKTSTTFTSINDPFNSSTVLESREGLLSDVALRAVVAVEAKGGWASGVLVSRDGHILTNAHALPPFLANITSSFRVLVDKKWVEAEALYIFSAPIDLAVLKIKFNINTLQITPMRLGEGMCTPGRSVAVVGYPLWRPSSRIITTPVVTVGTAALTVPAAPAMPAVILTTADVHAGASGGAVIDLETGCLVGLVTSNTRLGGGGGGRSPQQPLTSPRQAVNENTTRKQPGILFPNLNYCLGSAVLAPVIEMLTTERLSVQGNKVDWRVAERKLEERGVVEAWHSMRSMGENLGTVPNDQLQRKLPPALAALMESNNRVSGGAPRRPKL